MPRPHLFLQCVDDLLQRFHLSGGGHIVAAERLHGAGQDILHGAGQYCQLLLCRAAERQPLIPQLLCGFQHVHRVVGNALQITDGLQHLRGLLALLRAHLLRAELHQVGTQYILVVVTALLIAADALRQFRRIVVKAVQCGIQRTGGTGRHLLRHGAAALERQRRRGQQALVQLHRLFRLLLRAVRHDADG